MATTERLGMRGGSTESLAEAQVRLERAADDADRIRSAILRAALRFGEFHADHAARWPISQPNQIGAQVNALAKMGLLEKRNALGEVEHRRAQATASHGRASYVWRLTNQGRAQARRYQAAFHAGEPVEPTLFDAGREG